MKKAAKKAVRKFRKRSTKNGSEFSLESLQTALQNKTKSELIDMILSIVDEHDTVYKQFEQEAEVKAAKTPDTPENLLKKAKTLIDKGTKIDRNDPYFKKIGFGGPTLHLEPLDEVVKLLAKNANSKTFAILQKIAEYLLEKGKHYSDDTLGAETAFDYENSFETIAEAVIACKGDADVVLLWAKKVDKCDDEGITGDFYLIIEKGYHKTGDAKKKK